MRANAGAMARAGVGAKVERGVGVGKCKAEGEAGG